MFDQDSWTGSTGELFLRSKVFESYSMVSIHTDLKFIYKWIFSIIFPKFNPYRQISGAWASWYYWKTHPIVNFRKSFPGCQLLDFDLPAESPAFVFNCIWSAWIFVVVRISVWFSIRFELLFISSVLSEKIFGSGDLLTGISSAMTRSEVISSSISFLFSISSIFLKKGLNQGSEAWDGPRRPRRWCLGLGRGHPRMAITENLWKRWVRSRTSEDVNSRKFLGCWRTRMSRTSTSCGGLGK